MKAAVRGMRSRLMYSGKLAVIAAIVPALVASGAATRITDGRSTGIAIACWLQTARGKIKAAWCLRTV